MTKIRSGEPGDGSDPPAVALEEGSGERKPDWRGRDRRRRGRGNGGQGERKKEGGNPPAGDLAPPRPAQHPGHPQEGSDPPGPGHQGTDRHQGLPGHRADLTSRAFPRLHAVRLEGGGEPEDRKPGTARPSSARWSPSCCPRMPAASSCERSRRASPRSISAARSIRSWRCGGRSTARRPSCGGRRRCCSGRPVSPAGIIRDLFSAKVDALHVDSKELYNEIEQYLNQIDPELLSRVHLYSEPTPLFDKFDIESEIRDLFKARVELPTGGSHHHPAHRGAGEHRREHRPLHREEGSREDDPPHQPRGRARDRATDPAAGHRRHHRLRLHRHGDPVEPRQGAAGAAHTSGSRSRPHQGARRVRARPGGDDPAAGAAVALAFDDDGLSDLRRDRTRVHSGGRGAAAGAGPAAGGTRAPGARSSPSGCIPR